MSVGFACGIATCTVLLFTTIMQGSTYCNLDKVVCTLQKIPVMMQACRKFPTTTIDYNDHAAGLLQPRNSVWVASVILII